jgi:hypothetical protein
LSPTWGTGLVPQKGDTEMHMGEERRTIYIEPIEEPTPGPEPVSLPEEPRPIGKPDPEPAR